NGEDVRRFDRQEPHRALEIVTGMRGDDRLMVNVEMGGFDVLGMPSAAKQECELAQHCGLGGRAVLRNLAINERAYSQRRRIASLRGDARLCELKTAPGRSERKTRRKQHAIGNLARELEHLRSGRCDVDRILPPLIEYHLGTAQLVQRTLISDRLTRPQRAQRLNVL